MTICKISLTPTTKEPRLCHAMATTSAFNLKLCHTESLHISYRKFAHITGLGICIYISKNINFYLVLILCDIFADLVPRPFQSKSCDVCLCHPCDHNEISAAHSTYDLR